MKCRIICILIFYSRYIRNVIIIIVNYNIQKDVEEDQDCVDRERWCTV